MAEATDTKSLTNLILNKGGEIELLEDTTYVVSSNMVSKRSSDIIGPKDRSAVLKIGNKVSWAEQVPMMRFNSVKGLTFENVSFDGNFANCGKARGDGYQTFVRAVSSSDILFKNCYFHDNAGDGVRLDSCTDVVMTGCDASKLGHELIYAIYGCSDMQFYDNDVLNYCNSAFRLDSSAYDVDIYKNTIHSIIERASTGPGIEIAKGVYEGIYIDYNTIHTENGSGIWISGDRASCKDCQFTHNTFKNVGNFLNGSGKYNGYSNAGIAGAGLNGLLIEDNIFEDITVGYAILMTEAKHSISGSYKWNFKNNTLKNCKYGFRVSNSRGSISGGGNTFTNVKTLKYGITDNITVTAGTSDTTTPVENTTSTNEDIKVDVTITDASGKTGSQSLTLTTEPKGARSNGLSLVTLKLSADGLYGTKNIEFKPDVETILANTCTGTDWLAKVVLTRSGGKVSSVQFITPTIKGSGSNEIKIRTSDGMYGAGALAIALEEPDVIEEPETNEEVITVAKQTKYTLNLVDFEGNAIKVNSAADVQTSTKQDGNLIKGYVVFTTASGYTTGRIPISAPMIKQ